MRTGAILGTVAAVALVGAGAYLGGAYWIGTKMEDRLPDLVASFDTSANKFDLEVTDYERHFFGSTMTVRATMTGRVAEDFADEFGAPPAFRYRAAVTHGPLLFGSDRVFGAAAVDGGVALPAGVRSALKGKEDLAVTLPADAFMEADLSLGFGMDGLVRLSSPTYQGPVLQDPDDASESAHLEWGGLDGTIAFETGADQTVRRLDSDVRMPTVAVRPGPDTEEFEAQFEVAGSQLEADLRKPEGRSFWVGETTLGFDRASLKAWESGDRSRFTLSGGSLEEDSELTDGLVDSRFVLSVDELTGKAPDLQERQTVEDLKVDIGFNHLQADAIDRATETLAKAATLSQEAVQGRFQGVFEDLLAANPEIQLNRIRADFGEGPLNVEGYAKVTGDGPLPAPQGLAALLERLDAKLVAEVPKAALTRLQMAQLQSQYDAPEERIRRAVSSQQQNLLRQGFMEEDGDRFRTEARIKGSSLRINGRRLPLSALL